MALQGSALATIEMIKSDHFGGKRLFEAAYDAVDECGHDVLDPIHIVFAALVDDDAPMRVKQLIERYGFTVELAESVLALLAIDTARANIVVVGERQYMALPAVEMYASLALRFEVYVDDKVATIRSATSGDEEVTWGKVTDYDYSNIETVEASQWDFYTAQFQVATESGAESIAHLHALAYHARS